MTCAVTNMLKATLAGGTIAATLDIMYAFVRQAGRGRSPEWVLQSVASGWLGDSAFTGGRVDAAIGLVSHYGILLVAAGLYVLAWRRVALARRHVVLSGSAYGVLVYLFMNFVVLPLSAFPFEMTYTGARLLEGFVSHVVLVGLPIAVAARKFDRRHSTAAPDGNGF